MAARDSILHNFWWKLLSLLLAALTWLTIQTAFQKAEFLRETPVVTESRRTFPAVPITLLTSPGGTDQFAVYPSAVQVEVTGPINDLEKLQPREISAFVNVTDFSGDRPVQRPIQVQVGRGLKVDATDPIEARVEKVAAPRPAS